jgi:hypothetical protein
MQVALLYRRASMLSIVVLRCFLAFDEAHNRDAIATFLPAAAK